LSWSSLCIPEPQRMCTKGRLLTAVDTDVSLDDPGVVKTHDQINMDEESGLKSLVLNHTSSCRCGNRKFHCVKWSFYLSYSGEPQEPRHSQTSIEIMCILLICSMILQRFGGLFSHGPCVSTMYWIPTNCTPRCHDCWRLETGGNLVAV
jgi:hypothetical protein